MNIGEVIETLRQGGAAARAGWNGTGMRIYLKTFDRCEPCIVLVNAQGMHQPGWVASQADLLAEDWSPRWGET